MSNIVIIIPFRRIKMQFIGLFMLTRFATVWYVTTKTQSPVGHLRHNARFSVDLVLCCVTVCYSRSID